ncbi:hypothetical protein [Massilia sp. NP310]|uniref:hypothetical protein n=1 Tax=Massilia sp. NP310 TaxID=2861282 RepID=UPI001C62DE94|nr:hypothetical protein [Massilia sp. NP310]QYG04041.1 hypothetical protein KY496_11985 [Massilia sp. NP310]
MKMLLKINPLFNDVETFYEAANHRDISRAFSQHDFELGCLHEVADRRWQCADVVQQRWDARRAQREAKALLAECVEPAAGKTGGRL